MTHPGSKVVGAEFSSAFSEIVSADQAGNIYLWGVRDGKRQFEFNALPPAKQGEAGVLTAIVLDASTRRLLAATDAGTVDLWNFSNGQLLRSFALGSAASNCVSRELRKVAACQEAAVRLVLDIKT